MGRKKINPDELLPKDKIGPTFHKRKEGLKNKAKQLGSMCGCEVALIVFPPNECNNNDVIDVSVNGTIVEIFQKYSMILQQDPERNQVIYIPNSSNPQSSSSATQVQQPVQSNVERNEYAPSSNPGPQIQQSVPGSLEMNDYAPSMAHGMQNVFVNPNDHVGFHDQVAMPQQLHRCPHHSMQGVQHGNLQHGNLQHHIQQNANHIPLHHNNHVPMQHGPHIPPPQGHGTHYMLHNQMQAPAAMSHTPSYVPFAPSTNSPDSDGTIDNTQF